MKIKIHAPKIASRFVRLICFFLITVLATELLLRFIFHKTSFLSKNYINDDSWWRLRWVNNQNHDEKDIAQYYAIYTYHPRLGWTPQPNLKSHDIGFESTLTTNSIGVRGNHEYAYQKRKDTHRIITIGDSFTFGEEVNDDANFPSILETLIPNSEVINFAVGGYGHDQILLRLENEGLAYNPDIVILGFLPGDSDRNILTFRDYWKPKFIIENGGLQLVNSNIASVNKTLRQEIVRPKIIDLITMLSTKIKTNSGVIQSEQNKVTNLILDNIINRTIGKNAISVFVYLPTGPEMTIDLFSQDEQNFLDFCQKRKKKFGGNFICINPRQKFLEESKKGIKFRGGHFIGHYDQKGHALIASVIASSLQDQLEKK